MPAPNIPGFYYDEAKRKYFKILPNHVAPPDSKYSKESVQKEAEEILRHERIMARKQLVRDTCIQHSRVCQHPLGGSVGLLRELGNGSGLGGQNIISAAWARGLKARDLCSTSTQKLAYDDDSGTLICVGNHGNEVSYRSLRDGASNHSVVYREESTISSLTLSPSRFLMTTTMGDFGTEPSILICRLRDPTIHTAWYLPETSWNPLDPEIVDPQLLPWRLPCPRDSTPWASAANPLPNCLSFAVGTSQNTTLIKAGESKWYLTISRALDARWSPPGTSQQSDVLAVDWLDPNIIASGCRDGRVCLWDTRISDGNNRSWRLSCPASISHIRSVKPHKVVAAGIQDMLHTYDLRFTPQPNNISPPWQIFPTYRNKARNDGSLGFDVHQNLIAAATDDKSVQLFNMNTGYELEFGPGGRLPQPDKRIRTDMHTMNLRQPGQIFQESGRRILPAFAEGLKFAGGNGIGPKEDVSLVIAAGSSLEEWAW